MMECIRNIYEGAGAVAGTFLNGFKQDVQSVSGFQLAVKTGELAIEVLKMSSNGEISPGLSNIKEELSTIRVWTNIPVLLNSIGMLPQAFSKMISGVRVAVSSGFSHGLDKASGALLWLVSFVTKTTKDIFEMWSVLGALKVTTVAVPHQWTQMSKGWGAFIGGVSKFAMFAYCCMDPSISPESFANEKIKNCMMKWGGLEPFKVSTGHFFNAVDGVVLAAIGGLTLLNRLDPYTAMTLRVTSTVSQISARYMPRFVGLALERSCVAV